jgi:hypothetical protein
MEPFSPSMMVVEASLGVPTSAKKWREISKMLFAQKTVGIRSHFLTFSLTRTHHTLIIAIVSVTMKTKPTSTADALKSTNDGAPSKFRKSDDARRTSHSASSHAPQLLISSHNDHRRRIASSSTVARGRRSIQHACRLPFRKRLRDNGHEETTVVSDSKVCNEKHLDARRLKLRYPLTRVFLPLVSFAAILGFPEATRGRRDCSSFKEGE